MSTGATILDMTPMERVTVFRWVCQRPTCKHKWAAKDINKPPKRCAKCKRLDWNRETKAVGRPRKDAKPKRKESTKGRNHRTKKGK